MIKGVDIELYKHISDEMDAAEVYVGHIPFTYYFSVAQYSATCTEAFPFNAFDKVICELLKVEEELSFNQIGDILGLNVYSSESPRRYLDLGEKEVLLEALQALESDDFNMIEGGDINFSRCRLTKIGREYADKKSKFKTTENKPFSIFFDHTTGNNLLAKQHFEFVDGNRADMNFDIEQIEEAILKEIAAVQIPEIYNPIKQHSFTNPILQRHKSFSTIYPVGLTYNVRTKTFRLHCFDNRNKRIHHYFNDWINSNLEIKNDIIAKAKGLNSGIVQDGALSERIKMQILSYPESTKIKDVRNSLVQKEFIDEPLLYSYLNELINPQEEVQLYLCLPLVNDIVISLLSEIIQKSENSNSRFYIVFPQELSEKNQTTYKQLKAISFETKNLYLIQKPVLNFSFCSKKATESFYVDIVSISIDNISKAFFNRKVWDARATKIETMLLSNFSDEYSLTICNSVNKTINSALDKAVSKSQLDELTFFEFKLNPFLNMGEQASTVRLTLDLIAQFKHERITLLEHKINDSLSNIELKMQSVSTENEFKEIQKEFDTVITEILFHDSDLHNRSEKLKLVIGKKKEEFAEAKRVYSFIIDTNVFIKDPIIISKIAPKNKAIIAGKVLDELDGFKTNSQLKEVASKSIREIFADKNKNIHRAKANVKLLPVDFNKKSPDNLILAVALMYKDKNGVLISDDKGLHEKAKTVEMQVLTYDDFIVKFVTSKI